jgi:hypothetical protein
MHSRHHRWTSIRPANGDAPLRPLAWAQGTTKQISSSAWSSPSPKIRQVRRRAAASRGLDNVSRQNSRPPNSSAVWQLTKRPRQVARGEKSNIAVAAAQRLMEMMLCFRLGSRIQSVGPLDAVTGTNNNGTRAGGQASSCRGLAEGLARGLQAWWAPVLPKETGPPGVRHHLEFVCQQTGSVFRSP